MRDSRSACPGTSASDRPRFRTRRASGRRPADRDAIREQETIPELARRHGVHANQIYKWKREFLERAATVFERDNEPSGGSEREDELLKKLGELTVERDFLSRGLERRR